ncbi:hypothetical protein GCM10023159_21310 [Brevibacterium yomogidense]
MGIIASAAALTLLSACSDRATVEEFAGGVAPVKSYVTDWLSTWHDSEFTSDDIMDRKASCLDVTSAGFHTTIDAEIDLAALTRDDMEGYVGAPARKPKPLYQDTYDEALAAIDAANSYILHCSSEATEDCWVHVNGFLLEME